MRNVVWGKYSWNFVSWNYTYLSVCTGFQHTCTSYCGPHLNSWQSLRYVNVQCICLCCFFSLLPWVLLTVPSALALIYSSCSISICLIKSKSLNFSSMHFIDTSWNRPKDYFFLSHQDMNITPFLLDLHLKAEHRVLREYVKGRWGGEVKLHFIYYSGKWTITKILSVKLRGTWA